MGLSQAQIQTNLDNLNTIYATLSAEKADSLGSPVGASAAFKRLTEIQKQIDYWEKRLDAIDTSSASVNAHRPAVLRFGGVSS